MREGVLALATLILMTSALTTVSGQGAVPTASQHKQESRRRPLPGPQLHGLLSVNPFTAQNSSNRTMVDLAIFKDEQRSTPRC
jgi:hypothetical protein